MIVNILDIINSRYKRKDGINSMSVIIYHQNTDLIIRCTTYYNTLGVLIVLM